jgi:tRNA 2-thiouridine synthesizing protein A
MRANVVVDTTGLFCPMPIVKTSEIMKRIDEGAVVEVISDDPAIEHDLPAWCKSQGHAIEACERQGSRYHYFVRKSARKA